MMADLYTLELQYKRAMLKTQTSLSWINRKTRILRKLQDTIKLATETYKNDERAMIELEIAIKVAKKEVKKIPMKGSGKVKKVTEEDALKVLNGLPTAVRDKLIASLNV